MNWIWKNKTKKICIIIIIIILILAEYTSLYSWDGKNIEIFQSSKHRIYVQLFNQMINRLYYRICTIIDEVDITRYQFNLFKFY